MQAARGVSCSWSAGTGDARFPGATGVKEPVSY